MNPQAASTLWAEFQWDESGSFFPPSDLKRTLLKFLSVPYLTFIRV